jgi:pectate lyase
MSTSTRRIVLATSCIAALFRAEPLQTRAHVDLGRQVLEATDGWAAFGGGTTGGASADPANVFVVTSRRELIAALNDGVYPPSSSTPSSTLKVIYVDGSIDANVDDDNQPLTCDDYNRNGYTLEAFDVRAAYNGANDPDLSDAVAWTPVLYGVFDRSHRVPGLVESGAGPFNW